MMILRDFRETDAAAIAPWLTGEDEFLWWSAGNMGDYPLQADNLSAFYASHPDWMPKTLEDDGRIAGSMLMRWKDRESGLMHFGFIVVDGSKRGKGYGSGMLRLALAHAFDELGAKRVTLNVFEANAPAIRCYEHLGFVCACEWVTNLRGEEMSMFTYEKRKENA